MQILTDVQTKPPMSCLVLFYSFFLFPFCKSKEKGETRRRRGQCIISQVDENWGRIEQGLTRQWPRSSLSPLEGKEEKRRIRKGSAHNFSLFFDYYSSAAAASTFLLLLPPPFLLVYTVSPFLPPCLHRLVHSPPTWPPQVKIVFWQLKRNPKPGLFFFYTKTTNPPAPKANRRKREKQKKKKKKQLCSHHWRVVVAAATAIAVCPRFREQLTVV